MFLTVTPNPCIERTLIIPGFSRGATHRVAPENLRVNAGGKGINAARVAGQFGIETRALAWVGRNQRAWFDAQLARENVAGELVETTSDTRVCVNILDERGGKTEIIEAGEPLETEDGTRLLEKFAQLLTRASLVAICGSYPPAKEEMAFLNHATFLCRMARQSGVRVLLDSKGAAFEIALRDARENNAPLWCIKPNISEAEEFLRRPILSRDAELRALDELQHHAEIVLLSCGERGCYFARGDERYFLHAPQIEEISSVGSGDSLVGAFVAKVLHGESKLEALRWGVAAGAANAAQIQSGFCAHSEIAALVDEVDVEKL